MRSLQAGLMGISSVSVENGGALLRAGESSTISSQGDKIIIINYKFILIIIKSSII